MVSNNQTPATKATTTTTKSTTTKTSTTATKPATKATTKPTTKATTTTTTTITKTSTTSTKDTTPKTPPAKAAPAKATPTKAAPAKAAPAKTPPAKAAPAKTPPAKTPPAKATPTKAAPTKATPTKATPTKATATPKAANVSPSPSPRVKYGSTSILINKNIRDKRTGDLPNNQAVREYARGMYELEGLNEAEVKERMDKKDAGHIRSVKKGGKNCASNYMWEDRHDNRAHGDAPISRKEMKRAGRRRCLWFC